VDLANYYCRFVEGYTELAAPLTALGSPNARFKWTTAAQASFEVLKLVLSTTPILCTFDPPILCTFDPARRAVLTTDASGIAVAAILTQPNDAGQITNEDNPAFDSTVRTTSRSNSRMHSTRPRPGQQPDRGVELELETGNQPTCHDLDESSACRTAS
jgi:hypothetical protein